MRRRKVFLVGALVVLLAGLGVYRLDQPAHGTLAGSFSYTGAPPILFFSPENAILHTNHVVQLDRHGGFRLQLAPGRYVAYLRYRDHDALTNRGAHVWVVSDGETTVLPHMSR